MLRKYAKRTWRHLRRTSYVPLNTVELDHARLLHNVRLIAEQHPGMQVMPVLKGNAYGHGIREVATILNDAACSMLAVDGYFEAAQIRDISRHRLLVMGYILPKNVPLLDTKRCDFVVQDVAGLHAFGRLRKPVRVHLELNTGMYRMGLQPEELGEYLTVLKSYRQLTLVSVMSHLADADNGEDDAYTKRQVRAYDLGVEQILAQGFTPKLFHLAQTAGSVKADSTYANAVRLGIGTYGINPLPMGDAKCAQLAGLRPVLSLTSTIVKVLDLKKGDAVSYNGIFVAPHAMRVGVLPLGYYEGLPRALSNVGCVTHGMCTLPIIGRVCMNHTMIDLLDTNLRVGDQVTVISNDNSKPNSIIQMQYAHDLFAYSTLTGISNSVRRRIV